MRNLWTPLFVPFVTFGCVELNKIVSIAINISLKMHPLSGEELSIEGTFFLRRKNSVIAGKDLPLPIDLFFTAFYMKKFTFQLSTIR